MFRSGVHAPPFLVRGGSPAISAGSFLPVKYPLDWALFKLPASSLVTWKYLPHLSSTLKWPAGFFISTPLSKPLLAFTSHIWNQSWPEAKCWTVGLLLGQPFSRGVTRICCGWISHSLLEEAAVAALMHFNLLIYPLRLYLFKQNI